MLTVISCKGPQQPEMKTEVLFNVNQSLLADTLSDDALGIVYQPPLYWKAVDSAYFDQVRELFATQKPFLSNYVVRHYYQDDSTNSIMILTDLSMVEDSALDLMMKQMREMPEGGNKKFEVQIGEYGYHGFDVFQILLQNPAFINFKLIYLEGTDKKFQIDYMIPTKVYAGEVRTIESSIGSVNKINN